MICAVVLAAGRSRRMGTQKLLLPFGATTVIAHVAAEFLGSVVDEVYVVVGHDGQRIAKELPRDRLSIVANPDDDADMLDSVRCGLRALPQECEAVMVALGDQPGVTSQLINEMIQSFRTTDKGILVPVYRGKRGHPVLLSTCYCPEILTHYDDVGLRGLLWAHPEDVFELSVPTSAVLADMDYSGDYRRERALLEGNTAEHTRADDQD